jgi:hypothetical protein
MMLLGQHARQHMRETRRILGNQLTLGGMRCHKTSDARRACYVATPRRSLEDHILSFRIATLYLTYTY